MSYQRLASACPTVLPALLFAYLLAPGHPLTAFRGLPWDGWSLAIGSALGISLFGVGRPRAGWSSVGLTAVAALVVAAKLALWFGAPSYGFAASYYARARLGGTHERSSEQRDGSFTRIDRSLDGGLQLHFLNDVERFNFYQEGEPNRATLPFAARWEGDLTVPEDGKYTFLLTSTGPAVLFLGGQPVLTVPAGPPERSDDARVELAKGTVAVHIEHLHAGGSSPTLRAQWDPGGGLQPLGTPDVTATRLDSTTARAESLRASLARGVDFVYAVLVASFVAISILSWFRERSWQSHLDRPLLALYLLGFMIYGLATTRALYGRTVILEGGQDWLTYESYARDILLNGPLMTLGKSIGQGKPYFFQPFYPYYLAALHWLAGESLWGPVVLQIFGVGVAGVVLFYMANRLFGRTSAWWTLGLFTALGFSQLDWVARKLLSENLYFVLLPGAILALLRFADGREWRDLTIAGLLLGLAAVTRAPTLLYVLVAVVILAMIMRREGASTRKIVGSVVVLAGLLGIVVALVPLRNYIVSGRPALVATNGGATLLLAHAPSEKVRLGGIDRDPLFDLLSLDRPTREVAEFVRQDPVGFLGTLVPLALYTVGVSGAIEGTSAIAADIAALTTLYVLAIVLLPGALTLRAGLLHGFVAVHFLIMVSFLPYVYGYRQVLPMSLIMVPFAAALIVHLARVCLAFRGPSVPPDAALTHQRAD